MYKPDHITTVKTVKIYAPFPLKANERMVIVNGKAINVAASAGRQQGDYLYSATVTLLREDAAVYTTRHFAGASQGDYGTPAGT